MRSGVIMAIDRRRIETIVRDLRSVATDTQDIEVKEAVQRLPSSMAETVSAFCNGPGGTIVLGLSERDGFVSAPGFRAKPTADALATICSDKLTPPIRPEIDVVDFEGAQVVVAHVHELPPLEKPCYITERGVYQGSYVRVADGDRHLSAYEVDRLLEERSQPTHDLDLVPAATRADLDASLVESVLARQRALHPRIFGMRSDEEALAMLHVIARDDDGTWRPTLAGLLALGVYPQQFYPRLTVSFTAHPRRDPASGLTTYACAQTMAGPIPVVLADTLAAVRRSCTATAGLPLTAVREAIANALVHRDYAPRARGTAVQVSLSAGCLEVASPGGLYGTVTTDALSSPGYSSARNQYLLSLLETVPFSDGYLVENRKAGFRIICDELTRAGLAAPRVEDHISTFVLTLPLPTAGVSAADLARDELLGLLARRKEATAAELAAALGCPRRTVTHRLAQLVEQGKVLRVGKPRSPHQRYRLVEDA